MTTGANEADVVNKPGKVVVHEIEEAKANEADELTNGRNKAGTNEVDVAIMPTKADEADEPTSG